ncbi:MAG TPA: PH domain-containing protein [Acidimicrobiales bacterium]|nr:PH domain-containing protein [Acidimicrobiales bacterium]
MARNDGRRSCIPPDADAITRGQITEVVSGFTSHRPEWEAVKDTWGPLTALTVGVILCLGVTAVFVLSLRSDSRPGATGLAESIAIGGFLSFAMIVYYAVKAPRIRVVVKASSVTNGGYFRTATFPVELIAGFDVVLGKHVARVAMMLRDGDPVPLAATAAFDAATPRATAAELNDWLARAAASGGHGPGGA